MCFVIHSTMLTSVRNAFTTYLHLSGSSYLPFLDSPELENYANGLDGRTVVNHLIEANEVCEKQIEKIDNAYTSAELSLLDKFEQATPEEQKELEELMMNMMVGKEKETETEQKRCLAAEQNYLASVKSEVMTFFTALLSDINLAAQFKKAVKNYRQQVYSGLQVCLQMYEEKKGDLPPEAFSSEKMCRQEEISLFIKAMDDFIVQMEDTYNKALSALYIGVLPVKLPDGKVSDDKSPDKKEDRSSDMKDDVLFGDGKPTSPPTDTEMPTAKMASPTTTEEPTTVTVSTETAPSTTASTEPSTSVNVDNGGDDDDGDMTFLHDLTDEELEQLLNFKELDEKTVEAILEELYNREVMHKGSVTDTKQTMKPKESQTSATEATTEGSVETQEATTAPNSQGGPPVSLLRHGRPGSHHEPVRGRQENALQEPDDEPQEEHSGHIGPIIAFAFLGFVSFAVVVGAVVLVLVLYKKRRRTCRGGMMSDKQRLGMLKRVGYINPTYRFHELQESRYD